MQIKSPEELANILVDDGFTASKPIAGCSDSDIEELNIDSKSNSPLRIFISNKKWEAVRKFSR